jgi:hypothetical protein
MRHGGHRMVCTPVGHLHSQPAACLAAVVKAAAAASPPAANPKTRLVSNDCTLSAR